MSERAPSRVVELLADMLAHTTIRTTVREVETVRGPRGMALCLIVRFEDGDAWTLAAGPHHDAPDVEQLADEDTPMEAARKVWPEAEGFERVPGGWTFRCGGGYAWVADSGQVAGESQGSRRDAQRWMRQ